MRILIATEVFYPSLSGVAVTAERLATQMAERGHEVSVITTSRSRTFHKEHRKGYAIYRIPSWPNPFRRHFRFTIFPYRHLRMVLAEVNPQVVHIHDPAMLATSAVRLAKRRNIPVVVTNHLTFEYILTYLPWLKPLHPVIRAILAWDLTTFYNRCTVLTVPTETIKEYLEEAGSIKIPIQVISNGVDMSRFALYYRPTELIHRYHLRTNLPVITYVGRIDKEKNVEVLIEAFAAIHKQKAVQVVMVGTGDLLEEMKQKASELALGSSIRWIPRIESTSPMLNQLYHLTSVFCIASPHETESMVTLEAMASGLPVVAANTGALVELVKNGENGFIVPEDEPEAWAKAILTILQDDELRKSMAQMSIERVAERDLSLTMDAFEALYEELLRKKVDQAAPVLA